MHRALRIGLRVVAALALGACGSSDQDQGVAKSREDLGEPMYGSLAQVQACLNGAAPGGFDPATGQTICRLAPGNYVLDGSFIAGTWRSNLYLGRSGYALRGTSYRTRGGAFGTVITRTSPDVQAMIAVDPGTSNVTIGDVTLNGNRFAFSHNHDNPGRFFPNGCFPDNDSYIDVNIHPAAGPNVHLVNVSLYNAPGTSLQLAAGASADGLYITSARSTGIHMYGNGDRVSGSAIERSGTAAITVHGAGAVVSGNALTLNRYEVSDGVPGGQLNLEPESSRATVTGNSIVGGNYSVYPGNIALIDPMTGMSYACPVVSRPDSLFPMGIVGLEGYGDSHTVANNYVAGNGNGGMLIMGASPWSLLGNTVTQNGSTGYGGGIIFHAYEGRPNVGVAMTSQTISNNYRVGLSLESMVAWGGRGGCDGATVIGGNTVNVTIGANVDPAYVTTCQR
jgi:hypothetical protein